MILGNNLIQPTPSFLRDRIIDQAIAVAMVADGPKRVGAILLKKNKIIAAACNNYNKSEPLQAMISEKVSLIYNKPEYSKKIFGHAETLVLKKINNGDADTIVVCRLSGRHNSKKLRMARPCICCTHLILNFYPSIKHVHYSTEKGFMYENWI
jgi:deoxycytidylate deaminase